MPGPRAPFCLRPHRNFLANTPARCTCPSWPPTTTTTLPTGSHTTKPMPHCRQYRATRHNTPSRPSQLRRSTTGRTRSMRIAQVHWVAIRTHIPTPHTTRPHSTTPRHTLTPVSPATTRQGGLLTHLQTTTPFPCNISRRWMVIVLQGTTRTQSAMDWA